MIIVDQDGKGMFEFGPGMGIDVRGKQIWAYALWSDESEDFECGTYKGLGMADAVFDRIVEAAANGDKIFRMPPDRILKEAT